MLWHTRFVVTNFLGMSTGWPSQKRADAGTKWLYALRRIGGIRSSVWFGSFDVATGLGPLLVVHAGAGGNGTFNSFERAHQPHATRHTRAANGIFFDSEETEPPTEIVSLRAKNESPRNH